MELGTIYIIEHKNKNGMYKIGKTLNWESRKSKYSVYENKLSHWTFNSNNVSLSEKLLHRHYSEKRVEVINDNGGI